jgi:hypothetical protein
LTCPWFVPEYGAGLYVEAALCLLKKPEKYTAFLVISIEQVPVFLHHSSHFLAVSKSR